MENEDITFDEFINEYTKLTTIEKRLEIISELKEMIGVSEKLCNDVGVQHEVLLNRELVDLNKDQITEDDFLEGIYVYISSLKDSLGSYIEKIADEFYE